MECCVEFTIRRMSACEEEADEDRAKARSGVSAVSSGRVCERGNECENRTGVEMSEARRSTEARRRYVVWVTAQQLLSL